MPHIKAIRLVNIQFNNATQFYDDFYMELNGQNTTFYLENGGGKSVMLQMILQTVIPKTYLKKEKTIGQLFEGGKDRTSHVAVEWILDEGSPYKYLLTGFCARKRRSVNESPGKGDEAVDEVQASDVDHLNWCVFYNDNKVTDIKKAPLAMDGGHRYATFDDIRKYQNQMKQKGLPFEIFDRIEKYMHYISRHNLIFAEWNMIRGINGDENGIASYFRQNSSSKKLIENVFVRLVEEMEAGRGENGAQNENLLLADAIIEIQSKLKEYKEKQENIGEYERIKRYYSEFDQKNDSLLTTFAECENCKSEAMAVKNLICTELTKLEKDETETAQKRNEYVAKAAASKTTAVLLEAGLVNFKLSQLQAEEKQLSEDETRLSDRQSELEAKHKVLLTLENYDSYRSDKEKLDEVKERLRALEMDENSLQAEYRLAGEHFRFLAGKILAALRELLDESIKTQNLLSALGAEKNSALIEESAAKATISERIAVREKQEAALADKQNELLDFFRNQEDMTELLFSYERQLQKLDATINSYEDETDTTKAKICDLDAQLIDLKLQIARNDSDIKNLLTVKNGHESWLKAYEKQLASLLAIAAVFGEKTPEAYAEKLQSLIATETLSKLEKEIEVGRIKQKQYLSERHGYYVPNEEILALADKLGFKCEFVQTGVNWIAIQPPEDRNSLLQAFPYLPFSVIVDRPSFEKLREGKIKTDFASDYPVPIMNIDALRRTESSSAFDPYYICSFSDMVLDNDVYQKYVVGLDAKLSDIVSEISACNKKLSELGGRKKDLERFFAAYSPEQIAEIKLKLEATNREIAACEKVRREAQNASAIIISEKNQLISRIAELAQLLDESRLKKDNLQELIRVENEITELREQLAGMRKEETALSKKVIEIGAQLEELRNQLTTVGNQVTQAKIDIAAAEKEYSETSGFEETECGLTLEAARAKFLALKETIGGRGNEETSLRKQQQECEKRRTSLSEKTKREYDGDLDEIEKNEAAGARVTIPSREMIEQVGQAKNENDKRLVLARKSLVDISNKISKGQGRLEGILKDIPPEKGVVLPTYDSETHYEQEIESVKVMIKNFDSVIKEASQQLEKIKEANNNLSRQVDDFEEFIRQENIPASDSTATEMKDFRLIRRRYDALKETVKKKEDEWKSRLNSIRREAAGFKNFSPIDELGSIEYPHTLQQSQANKQNFIAYGTIIDEQIQKIGRDLVYLAGYHDGFATRCVQRAELIISHLRKIEPLSRIQIYGRRINMIELGLKEFDDTTKSMRMKSYIDSLVGEINDNLTVEDKKRIAAKLSAKELLAQIADMNNAKVRLYKTEALPENSRLHPWETAIGSSGQDNSLYFIFAACLISFIRMMSISNSSAKTKKVIIADNPFGPTSSAYLWDPMFEILKQNDVQLIAPAHSINREITSRFSVNYVLQPQVLTSNRMRVVVKDVRVEEDESVRKYIEPEQLPMFSD